MKRKSLQYICIEFKGNEPSKLRDSLWINKQKRINIHTPF
jgi:hypothetical protein